MGRITPLSESTRIYIALFLALWLGLSAVGREKMLRDPGTFWHTVVGDRILATGSVPTQDEFSFTCGGQRWMAQQWLGEVLMALMHRVAMLDGLLTVSAIIIAMVYAGIGARLREGGLSTPACVVMTALAAAASAYHFFPRPHLGTLAGIFLCYSILNDVESGRMRWTRLLLLPVIVVVWTNIHGGVLGGIVTVLFVSLGWLLLPVVGLSPLRLSSRQTVLVGVAAGGCIGAMLVNPYGAALPAQWIGLMGSEVLPRIMIEHAPLQVLSVDGLMIGLVAVIYGVLLIRAWPSERRVTWLVPLIWVVMTLSRVRHGPLFAITAMLAIADMVRFARLGEVVKAAREGNAELQRTRGLFWAVPVAAMVVSLGLQNAGIGVPVVGHGWARPPANYWPTQTVEALELRSRASDGRVFNDMLFGGYLIYHSPGLPVYLDDRCELYGDAGLVNYARAYSEPAYFESMTTYESIDTALVMAGTTLDGHLSRSAGWVRLAGDEASTLYARRKDAPSKVGG